MVAGSNGSTLGVEIIAVLALAAPWPILAVLGWIFYRASRAERAAPPDVPAGERLGSGDTGSAGAGGR